jgi:hypothetical protein
VSVSEEVSRVADEDLAHAWVRELLAGDEPGPIPPQVASRIESALRATASGRTGPVPLVPPATFRPPAAHSTDPVTNPLTSPIVRAADRPAASSSGMGDDPAALPAIGRGSRGSRRVRRDELAEDRRHRILTRLLPAVAAAVVLVAGSAAALGRWGPWTGDDEAATVTAAQEAGPESTLVPNGLVSTGTAYTATDLTVQVQTLVTAVTSGDPASLGARDDDAEAEAAAAGSGVDEAAEPDAAGSDVDEAAESPPVAGGSVVQVQGSGLADVDAFRQCAADLGSGDQLPVAIDLATYEGSEAAIVVLPTPTGTEYLVIVTDRACNPGSERATQTVPVS